MRHLPLPRCGNVRKSPGRAELPHRRAPDGRQPVGLCGNGAYVRDLKLANGTDIFKITGPGNLQGSDAADALITSITAQNAHDDSYTNDTYTVIPFKVTGAGPLPPRVPE